MARVWTWESDGNGERVTLTGPRGQTVFLQGDSARVFIEEAERTHDGYTDSDLCGEYAEVAGGAA